MARPISRREFARYKAQGVGTNVVSYVGFGAIRKAVIGDAARAPTPDELAKEKALTVQGMCEGAIGLSAGLFYAPQIFAKTDEVIALAQEAGMRGGIYDTHQRDESVLFHRPDRLDQGSAADRARRPYPGAFLPYQGAGP